MRKSTAIRISICLLILCAAGASAQNERQWISQGKAAEQRGQLGKAINLYKRVLVTSPDAETHFLLGRALLKNRQLAEGAQQLQQAVDQDIGHTEAFLLLGMYYDSIGESKKAAEVFRKGLTKYPAQGTLLREYGQTLIALGDNNEAASVLARAVQSNAEDPETYAIYSQVLNKLGQYQRALEMIDTAMPLAEKSGDRELISVLHTERGDALVLAGKSDQAFKAYLKALAFDPKNGRAAFRLGLNRLRADKLDEAKKYLAQAVRAGYQTPRVFLALGLVLARQERYGPAARSFEEGLKLEPESVELMFNLGQVFLAQKMWDNAIEIFKKAKQINADYPGLQDRLDYAHRMARKK